MIKAQLNFPINTISIKSLVEDEQDLKLMMPSADLPFNEGQWKSKLETLGALSFLINRDNRTIGHFAFIRINQEMQIATLGLVYLRPEYRKTGISRDIVELAEQTAIDLLNTKTMLLNVMSQNMPAHNLYSKLGYLAYEKVEDLVRMKKEIQKN